MIYVFYNNDPLGNDQGGGVEHFRCVHRALKNTNLAHKLVGLKKNNVDRSDENVIYVKCKFNVLSYFYHITKWFYLNRKSFSHNDVFHFHRNYFAWAKFFVIGRK